MLQRDLYNYLTETADIAALFPGGVHHMSVPQDVKTWPAVSFQLITQSEQFDDMEAPNDVQKMDSLSYQFDVVADSSAAAIAAGESFVEKMRRFRGTMTTTRVQWVSLSNIAHLEDRRGDKLRRRVSIDLLFYIDVT